MCRAVLGAQTFRIVNNQNHKNKGDVIMKSKINESVPKTHKRVPQNTASEVNRRIYLETAKRLDKIGSDPKRIRARLEELDHEWDVERVLEANAASVSLLGITLGLTTNRKWFALPALVSGFLLQHAVQGWCPPLPILRRLGIRTQREIDNERTILLARLGEFEDFKDATAKYALHQLERKYH